MNSASQVEAGLEEEGQVFPFSIPPKNTKKEFERSLSPIDWNEMWSHSKPFYEVPEIKTYALKPGAAPACLLNFQKWRHFLVALDILFWKMWSKINRG